MVILFFLTEDIIFLKCYEDMESTYINMDTEGIACVAGTSFFKEQTFEEVITKGRSGLLCLQKFTVSETGRNAYSSTIAHWLLFGVCRTCYVMLKSPLRKL